MAHRSTNALLESATILIFLTLAAYGAAAQSGPNVYGDGPDKHWRLRSESKSSNEPVRSGGIRYRLITAGGQLSTNTKVFEGLRLVHAADATENIVIHPQDRASVISLNEPVALYSYTRRAYVVYKKGRDFSLGFEDYEPSREPPMKPPSGIHQWVFTSVPGAAVRDHRTRGIVTLETLGLFNRSADAYLVYDSQTQTLRWRER